MAPLIAKLETIIVTPAKPKEACKARGATKIKTKIYTPGSRGCPPNSVRPSDNSFNSGRKKKFHTKPVTTPPK